MKQLILLSATTALSLVACSPIDPPPAPSTTLEDQIEEASLSPSWVERSPDGHVAAISARVPVPRSVMNDPAHRASWFLAEFGDELGVQDPLTDLEVIRTVAGPPGSGEEDDTLITYQRVVHGVPVFAGQVKVEVDGTGTGFITTVISDVPADVNSVDTTPSIDRVTAMAAAIEDMDGAIASTAELVVLNEGMLEGTATPSRLAWQVKTRQAHLGAVVTRFVDASDGTVMRTAYDEVSEVRNRRTYDAQGEFDRDLAVLANDLVLTERGAEPGQTPDSMETLGHDTAATVWDYFWNTHGRDSHDDHGAEIVTYVHRGTEGCNVLRAWTCSASWAEGAMWFSDNMITNDIFGHEYTHGVVGATAGLLNQRDSGAVNESMADVFGQFIDNGDWTIGEDSVLGTLRNMQDPAGFSRRPQPRHVDSKAWLPEDAFLSPFNDFGGVHTNSGILNYAAYLINAGGTNADTGIEVSGIGQAKSEVIYYRAVTWYLTPSSTFSSARRALRLTALKYANEELHSVTHADCGSILNAYSSVGIGDPDTDNDCFADPVDTCPEEYNPDQEPEACGDTACGDESSACMSDDDCCEEFQCVSGTCALNSCTGPGALEDSCDQTVLNSCCDALTCGRAVGGGTTCCQTMDEPCTPGSDAECCGQMTCSGGGFCVCRTVGESCLSARECCGSSICQAGSCV